jgi:Ulp1 family protease
MFYKRLTNTPTKAKADSFEKDPNLSLNQKRHLRVQKWTKNVDLFKKDMIIIPICEHSHWYLVIVIKPGLIQLAVGSEERQAQGEPFFIVMDSMGHTEGTAAAVTAVSVSSTWPAPSSRSTAVGFP